jgi:hypothetical protein
MPPHQNIVSIFGEPLDHVSRNVRRIPPVDLYEQLNERPVACRGLLDRIAGALGSERMFGFFLGFYSGIMFGCASLIFWLAVMK